ncbi:hypothetical protein N7478_008962 [Penicillium angulare]|uniref:uncharacterized protein n=1 Tax=Penicillium angulare TaxID=116970 RepID=UPI002541E175|nr:uncharacterized protein N7478_008962 [Penicillium angulare]KAJ5273837.1 hypothetical protein N7478_008962 [Penicillium angulare]
MNSRRLSASNDESHPSITRSFWAPPASHPSYLPSPQTFDSGVQPSAYPVTSPALLHPFGPTPSASGTDPSHSPDIIPSNKVAIPRIIGLNHVQARRRSARACESCRHRKIKCDGKKPVCGQCIYHKNRCMYEDAKRIRDEKQLKSLTGRIEKYEKLLHSLEGDVDPHVARKIRKTIKIMFNNFENVQPKDENHSEQAAGEQSDSSSSVGSLDAVDIVGEDLDRNENTRAAGFFGKNSEISWIQKLEDNSRKTAAQSSHGSMDFTPEMGNVGKDIPIASMNYHLDDLDIPFVDNKTDPFAIPDRELADEYFNSYMELVHPFFSAVRKSTFTSQYLLIFERPSKPSRKWLAILNMIFAIGCRHCRMINVEKSNVYDNEMIFLTRARQLSIHSNTLFEHSTLQQIQLEFLVSLYLLCAGQLNRASKFADMALYSAISLGINLRFEDENPHDESKESRCRLWWSIYALQHLLTSMHGRASRVGEGICSVTLPIPVEEESFENPEIRHLLHDSEARINDLNASIFEKLSKPHVVPDWATKTQPCPSLFFYYLVDLSLVSQAVLNKVYSIEGMRQGSDHTEHRIHKYGQRMDRWLAKIPPDYQFHIPDAGPWSLNHSKLDDDSAPHARERVCLALYYYSARITLCRPCLSLNYSPNPGSSIEVTHREKIRAELATNCLQASCSLISVFPENVDIAWLARVTPWWAVLHFLMQSTTALLLALSYSSLGPTGEQETHNANGASNSKSSRLSGNPYAAILDTDLSTAFTMSKKAVVWIHAMASVDPAAKRAFLLCDDIVRKIAPTLQIDLSDWPTLSSFGDSGRYGVDPAVVMDMSDLEDFVAFEDE